MKKIIRHFHKAILAYFVIIGILSVIILLYPGIASTTLAVKIQPVVLGLWLISAWYVLVVMVFNSSVRDNFFVHLAVVKERDECEEYIVGKSAKAVFLVTLGGFLAVAIWGMSTVNMVFVQKSERMEDGIRKAVPFIGLALPIQWQKHTQMAWVQHNPEEPIRYESVEDVRVMIYKKGYSICLTPPIHPELSRIMILCALLQVGLFHLFARLLRNKMNLKK